MAKPPSKSRRVADQLARRIDAGEFGPGEWLPSARELSATYSVDRSTVRRALDMLGQRGVVVLHESEGATVAPVSEGGHADEGSRDDAVLTELSAIRDELRHLRTRLDQLASPDDERPDAGQ